LLSFFKPKNDDQKRTAEKETHMEHNELSEILQDPKQDGKERPWRSKKIRSLVLADSFDRLDEPKRAERVRYCGTILEFTKELESGRRFLSRANFCRERLCPFCQWRRSLRMFFEVSQVMDYVGEDKSLVPLFLTLTLRNCPAVRLGEALDQIFGGWYVFTHQRKIRRLLTGWFRALELTYNKETDEFHPHIHAIIFVEKSYFENSYLVTSEWVHLWRISLGLDYDPICDIRKIKNNQGRRKGIAEVSKYTVKDYEIATSNKSLTDHLVSILNKDLKGRRLYAYGGILKKAAAILFSKNYEDLVSTEDETIREDVATVIERYRWNFGLANYEKVKIPKTAGLAEQVENG
jgi:plasmid rolling circle replication initiator protein Rep